MASCPLVTGQAKAGTRLLRAFEEYVPVVVAFWFREVPGGPWTLCLVPEDFGRASLTATYQRVCGIAREMDDPYLSPLLIRIMDPNDPMARAAIDYYRRRPPRIPYHVRGTTFQLEDVEELYLIHGPLGEPNMPTGREVLDTIIDREAAFFEAHGYPPRRMKLPVMMAYNLSKCGRNELGDQGGRVFWEGITAFEKDGIHGMKVEIVRDRNAVLELE